MKREWQKLKIDDVARVGDGAHASIKRVDKGVRYLTSKNFSLEGIRLTNVDYISEENYFKYFKADSKALTKPEKDDVLLSIIGSMGAPYLVKDNKPLGLSSSVSILRPKEELITPLFLYYWIKGDYFQKSINSIKSGVAQSFLSLAMIKSLPCVVPPLPTQQKIADILSAYDDLIENNLKRIELLEEQAQLMYEEWFVRMKFPGYESAVIDSETDLPEGWEKKSIGKVCNVSGGGTPSKSVSEYWEDGNITWFSPTDLSKSGSLVQLDSSDKITEVGLQKSSAKLLGPDSFMMTSRATIGLFGIIDKPFSTNQGFINITPKYDWLKEYLLYCLKFNMPMLLNYATGSTFLEISKSAFKKIEIVYPDADLIKAFHWRISENHKLMLNLTKQNKLLKEARDILLPRLMTGMIEV